MKSLNSKSLAVLLFLSFFVFNLLLPVFNGKQFYNPFFSQYNLTFSDAQTPIHFEFFMNLIKNKTKILPHNLTFIEPSNNVDLTEVSSGFFSVLPPFFLVFLFPFTLPFLSTMNPLNIFKALLFGNLIFASLSLVMLFFLQLELGFRKYYAFFSSLAFGFCTGWFIYSHFLLRHIVEGFLFILTLFFCVKYINSKKKIFLYSVIVLISSLSVIVPAAFISDYLSLYFLIFLPVFYYAFKFGHIDSIIPFSFLIFLGKKVFTEAYYSFPKGVQLTPASYGAFASRTIFNLFPFSQGGLNTELFGFQEGVIRFFSFIYGFLDNFGNAIFINSYGIFGALFSEKGFVYNSPFLLFSFLGLTDSSCIKKFKKFFLWIILICISTSLLTIGWFGGYTPRYVRHYFPAIFLLCIFAFAFLQNNKSLILKGVFFILIFLSFFNVLGLTIRQDWSFEHPDNIPSYDYVLIPFIDGGFLDILNTNLTYSKDCAPIITDSSIVLDMCNCLTPASISENITLNNSIRINYCSEYSGGDGVSLKVSFNGIEEKVHINSNECGYYLFDNIPQETGVLNISVERFGICDAEMVEIYSILSSEK